MCRIVPIAMALIIAKVLMLAMHSTAIKTTLVVMNHDHGTLHLHLKILNPNPKLLNPSPIAGWSNGGLVLGRGRPDRGGGSPRICDVKKFHCKL